MKKSKKWLIALIIGVLACALLCFALVGCGDTEPPDSSNADDKPSVGGEDDKDPSDDPQTGGFKVTFVCDEHVTVYVYMTQDMSGDGEKTNTAYSRNSESGELTDDGTGQVNFLLVFDKGYEKDEITLSGERGTTYGNLKGSEDTGVENGYRVTKVAADMTVTVSSKQEGAAEDLSKGFKITFTGDEHVRILTYKTQNMDGDGDNTNVAYSRDQAGQLLNNGEGQVNFKLVFDEGYELASLDDIVISAGYKNLKIPAETGVVNGYRITKITAELTVRVTSSLITEE